MEGILRDRTPLRSNEIAIDRGCKTPKNRLKTNRPEPPKPSLLLAALCRKSVASLARETTRFVAGLEQYIKQGKFFALQPLHLGAHAGAAHQLIDDLFS